MENQWTCGPVVNQIQIVTLYLFELDAGTQAAVYGFHLLFTRIGVQKRFPDDVEK